MIFAVASDGNRKLRALRIIVFVPEPYRQVENVWLGGDPSGWCVYLGEGISCILFRKIEVSNGRNEYE